MRPGKLASRIEEEIVEAVGKYRISRDDIVYWPGGVSTTVLARGDGAVTVKVSLGECSLEELREWLEIAGIAQVAQVEGR